MLVFFTFAYVLTLDVPRPFDSLGMLARTSNDILQLYNAAGHAENLEHEIQKASHSRSYGINS